MTCRVVVVVEFNLVQVFVVLVLVLVVVLSRLSLFVVVHAPLVCSLVELQLSLSLMLFY